MEFIKSIAVGVKFVIVPKTKHTFSNPIVFEVAKIEKVESEDPYHPFTTITLTSPDGLDLAFDTGSFSLEHSEYKLYRNYQMWLEAEIKKVEEKKQTYLLAKKYTEDFDKFYKRFSDENPDKLI